MRSVVGRERKIDVISDLNPLQQATTALRFKQRLVCLVSGPADHAYL